VEVKGKNDLIKHKLEQLIALLEGRLGGSEGVEGLSGSGEVKTE